MKKIIWFAGIALALALVTGCFAPDGNVYLSFDWTYAPEWFGTDDPNLPDTIWRNVEYPTEEGSWYFEYYHDESHWRRWIAYTLTAHDGYLPYTPGEDARFELFLHAFSDPVLIQWQSMSGTVEGQPDSVGASASAVHAGDGRIQTYEQTMTSAGWTLSVAGGVIEPGDR